MEDIILESDGENLIGLYFFNDSHKNIDKFEENSTLPLFEQTKKWLDDYFCGKEQTKVPKYKLPDASEFRRRVWEIIQKIPYGKTITYGEIANIIAKESGIEKMSAQAVGNALNQNPICIIIPCHRVIGKSGNLVGYGGGMNNKKILLELEHKKTRKWISFSSFLFYYHYSWTKTPR